MDDLARELSARGVVDPAGIGWARADAAEHEVPLDVALLRLELLDEQELIDTIAATLGTLPATPQDFLSPDPALAARVPEAFARSHGVCPVRTVGDTLLVLIDGPLAEESAQELGDLLGCRIEPRGAGAHQLAVAYRALYGTPLDDEAAALEARLASRRPDRLLEDAIEVVQRSSSKAGVVATLQLATCLVDEACLMFARDDSLLVLSLGKGGEVQTRLAPLPSAGCALWAALVHGGHYLGPLPGAAADEDFYAGLGRPLPRRALVAPVSTGGAPAVLYADNGPRAIAPRWAVELTYLAAVLGQRRASADGSDAESTEAGASSDAAAEPPADERSTEDEAAIARLRSVAAERGLSLAALVDSLLAPRPAEAPASAVEPAAALFSEVKGMFEKLATDIPAQLARGMEPAFRDLVRRLGANPAPAPGAAAANAPTPRPAVDVELVQVDAAPREVESYRSRRRKSKRIKL